MAHGEHEHVAPLAQVELLERGQDEDSRFAHARLCLADHIHTQDRLRDAFLLDFGRVLESTVTDCGKKVRLQQEVLKTNSVNSGEALALKRGFSRCCGRAAPLLLLLAVSKLLFVLLFVCHLLECLLVFVAGRQVVGDRCWFAGLSGCWRAPPTLRRQAERSCVLLELTRRGQCRRRRRAAVVRGAASAAAASELLSLARLMTPPPPLSSCCRLRHGQRLCLRHIAVVGAVLSSVRCCRSEPVRSCVSEQLTVCCCCVSDL